MSARTVGQNLLDARSMPVWLPITLLAAAAVVAFLMTSSATLTLGYPLDDAWIHQTYARNLGQGGEWAFVPGQPSAGSTAPLWTALLALGYVLGLPHLAWAYLLGFYSLLALAWLGERTFRDWLPGENSRVPWVGLFLAGEWHLVWAAVSGMETLLSAALILLVLWRVGLARGRSWLAVGLLIGLSVWVRPDGITLLGPAGLTLLLVEPDGRARIRSAGWLALGVGLFFLPYLGFNLVVQGSVWPNTFYAKQAEYAVLRELPLLTRLFNELKLPLIGAGLLLLPGAVAFVRHAWITCRWTALAGCIWFVGYALLYALRLPVTYQYGRYFIPAMPVYFVAGLAGTVLLARTLSQPHGRFLRMRWVLLRVWLLTNALVWLGFLVIGAGRYAQDVAVIEEEMVASAQWIAQNTPPDAIIAAHDIGALGYFGQRNILDLAGLVSPEVIPFIRDEPRMATWLDQQQANYLVVLSGWYDTLPQGRDVVYQSEGTFSPQAGGGSMIIYQWVP